MKGFKPFLFLGFGLILCTLIGCGGKVPISGPPALNFAGVPLPNGAVAEPYKELIVVTGGLQPYTYTITGGSLPPGLSMDSSGVISGTPTMMGTSSFIVRVTDSQTPVEAANIASFNLTINAQLTFPPSTLSNATIGLAYSGTITASGGVMPYTYALASGSSLPAGLALSANGDITGTPTGPVGTFSFTAQVTDAAPVQAGVATQTFSLTVGGVLAGNFSFSFNGYNSGQAFYMAGSFVGDGGGNITSGVLDQNGLGAPGVITNAPFTGTYSINSNHLGSLTLTIPALKVTYNYVLAASLNGDLKFILADPNFPQTYGSGVIKAQQLTTLTLASLAGNYGLGFFGVDPAGNRSAGAGAFKADGSGNLTQGIEDTNDNGTVNNGTGHSLIFTGSWALDTNSATTGRGTETLNVNGKAQHYAFYVVDPTSELITVQIDPVSSGASLSLVSVLKQLPGSVTGSFSNSTLNGSSVLELNGYTGGSSPLPDVSLGVSAFDGMGHITLYQTDENKGGMYIPPAPSTGTYSVDTMTGRVTVTGLGSGSQPVWYLVNTNRAFVIGTDSSVTQGSFEAQTGAPFTLPSFLVTYAAGTIDPVLPSVTNAAESTSITPPGGTIVVTYDSSGPGGPQMNLSLTSGYVLDPNNGANTGRFILTAMGSPVPTQIVYIITGQASGSSKVGANKWAAINVAMPSGSADPNPVLTYAESTHP